MMNDRDTNADDGRSQIVRHALELLNDVHPEDLSIREVARRAGLSSGAPYHHFKTKTDLLAACAVVAWTDLCEALETDKNEAPHEQLLRQTSAYLRFARSNPGPYQLMTSRLLDGDQRFGEIVELRARAIGGVIAVIKAATEPRIDQATAKFRGVAAWSMLHGHLTLNEAGQLDRRPDTDGAIADLATRMALLPVAS